MLVMVFIAWKAWKYRFLKLGEKLFEVFKNGKKSERTIMYIYKLYMNIFYIYT